VGVLAKARSQSTSKKEKREKEIVKNKKLRVRLNDSAECNCTTPYRLEVTTVNDISTDRELLRTTMKGRSYM
jgi:hypothetical protein